MKVTIGTKVILEINLKHLEINNLEHLSDLNEINFKNELT